MQCSFVIDAGNERMSIALDDFVAAARSRVGSALWLAPSVRAASEVRRRLAMLGKPLVCPNVCTFESFAVEILRRARKQAVLQVPLRLLIEDAARQLARAGKLDYFLRIVDKGGFLVGAEGLVRELDAAAVLPDQFVEAATHVGSPKLVDCAELFSAVCRHAGWVGNPVAPAGELIGGTMPPPFEFVDRVFLDGFVTFSPAEWRLLEALTKIATLTVCLPECDPDREEVFAAVADTRARLVAMSVSVKVGASSSSVSRPAALAHLDRHLFADTVAKSTDATGLALIEAPGEIGEARLVARRIRSLIAEGVRPDDIVVTARDMSDSIDLLDDVFAEYGVPFELECDTPIARNPAVATLVRAARLADEDFPFAGVTALLRSTYFRPEWPEGDTEIVRRSERLLRLVGIGRHSQAYLRAIKLWSEAPPDGLEDEEAEQPRRLQKARLAVECRPFMERFFKAWDGMPESAEPSAFVGWIREFAREIGLLNQAGSEAADETALGTFFAALDRQPGPAMSRSNFLRLLTTIAAGEKLPPEEPKTGQVRVLRTGEARYFDCDYLFILGLGERSFPRLGPPISLLDDAARSSLRDAGLPLADPTARLADEQLLFLQLIARPRRGLVLSYPATDAKGQPLLPGSFLRAALDCFAPGTVKPEHQRMLIQGYTTRRAFSPAEARVQFAARMRDANSPTKRQDKVIDADLCQHLGWASEVATARFGTRDYNSFDGRLETPSALDEVKRRFGPDRVFSPTSLEAYIACPFRFFLEHVLGLEELEEPSDDVEQTRRGAAYHRALARLHRSLDPDLAASTLPDHVDADLLEKLDEAVREYAERAPSPAAKKLWELEGRRLRRSAAKYREHWDEFLVPWREKGAVLRPNLLETDFGLPPTARPVQSGSSKDAIAPLTIVVGDVEVRIGGRIDRVDVADLRGKLGFWIVDYKSGRSTHYPGTEVSRLEKLQLSLYALAVERVFFSGRDARPLGLAYWLVMDDGPKSVMPGSRSPMAWLADPDKWIKFREQLERWVANVVSKIRDGRFPLAPRSENCTDTCSFGEVCRISQSRNIGKVWDLSPPADQ